MAFCYALVSRGNIPLCQHCAVPGNFDLYYQKFIPKEEPKEEITIHRVDGYIWGIKSTSDLNILCVVRDDCDKSALIRILNEIQTRFLRIYQNEWKKASTFSLQSYFEPYLIDICKLVQPSPISLNEIVPPSQSEIESSDADEYLLLNPSGANGQQKKKYQKRGAKKVAISIISVLSILALLFVIYYIVTLFCGGWKLSKCF